MAWFLGQSFVIILLAFVLGLLVGWLWWGRPWRRTSTRQEAAAEPAAVPLSAPEPTPEPALPAEPVREPEPEPELVREPEVVREPELELVREPEPAPAKPSTMDEQRTEPLGPIPVAEDDLERIEGIGPRMATALRQAGISTYQELAGSDQRRLRAAIEAAGLRFAPSLTTWPRQARLLADGDEAGFADLTRRLVAGRDTGRS